MSQPSRDAAVTSEIRRKQMEMEVLGELIARPKETVAIAKDVGFSEKNFYYQTHSEFWIAGSRKEQPPASTLGLQKELELLGSPSIDDTWKKVMVACSSSVVDPRPLMLALIDDTSRHKISTIAFELHERCREGRDFGKIGVALQRELSILDAKDSDKMPHTEEGMSELLADIESDNFLRRLAVETGFPDFDAMVQGFRRQQLVVLGARPSMGKTVICLQIAGHAAMVQKKSVLFISLEMSREQIQLRLMSAMTNIPMRQIEHNTGIDWAKMAQAQSRLHDSKFHLHDRSASVDDLYRICTSHATRHGSPDLIVLDYLGLLRQDRSFENRTAEISYASQAMKSLSKELNCAVMCAAQLNRQVESRSEKRPLMSDLRDSGSIEQDADLVLLLHRDDYYDSRPDTIGLAEVIIAKNRQGPTGKIFLEHKFPTQKFIPTTRRTGGL